MTGLKWTRRSTHSLSEALVFGQRCGRVAVEALREIDERLTARAIDWANAPSDRPRITFHNADLGNSSAGRGG